MEPNERHQQQHQSLSSPYFHHHHHHLQQHHPTAASTGNAVPSPNNGLFPPQQQQQHQPQANDGSSSHAVYPHSVPSSAVTAPAAEPLKRKRGRPRKYVTPEQALEAKKMASAASSSSAKEKREQAAAAGGGTTTSSNPKKSQLGSVGKTGQSFTPHIVNIAPGEDVAQKIVMFAQQSKHELCVLSASGTISTASLRQPGGNMSYEGQYEIISLSGSFIRAEQGGKTGGLGVSLSRSDGQIIGGAVGTHLTAAGPVQVILGTFQLDRKKDAAGSGAKGEASNSGSRLTSPSSTGPGTGPGPLLGMGFRSVMESPGRNPMRGNDEQHHQHHQQQQTGMGGSHHFMMQAPQGMHMTHSRPSEWGGGGGGNSGHDGRGGGGYDLSGRLGHESSENGDYEQQMPD